MAATKAIVERFKPILSRLLNQFFVNEEWRQNSARKSSMELLLIQFYVKHLLPFLYS
jgi:hypothetical protein